MKDEIFELSCNLDDMTGEELGFASEMLLNAGALDVYTIPIGMKKNRPGVMLNVLCRPESREKMVKLLFLHTTTIGVRETRHDRYREQQPEQPEFPGLQRLRPVPGLGLLSQGTADNSLPFPCASTVTAFS